MTDGDNSRLWFQAALIRAKKLPELEKLLSKKKLDKKEVGEKLKSLFADHNKNLTVKKGK